MDDLALNPAVRGQEGLWLKALLQATDYGVLLSDLNRQDLAANRRLGELFELDPEQLVSSNPDESRALGRERFAAPEEFEQRLAEIYRDPGLSCTEELHLTGSDPRVVRRTTMPVRTPGGTPIGRLWTFQDVTETRRLQIALHEQLAARTEDLRATNEVMQAIYRVGQLARAPVTTPALVEGIAGALSSLLGFGACALLLATAGGGLSGVFHPANGGEPHPWEITDPALVREVGAAEVIRVQPVCPIGPTDSDPPACLATAVRSGTCVDGLLFFFSDGEAEEQSARRLAHLPAVADHVALALATHRLQGELRTALTELQAAQKQVVQAERLRTAGTLAAGIAHDIRNILAPLQLELAQAEPANLEEVKVHLQRFSTLTHRLISFARPGSLDYSVVRPSELAHRMLPLILGQAEHTGVRIELAFNGDLPEIRGDADQLEHVLLNLCLNAIQAMAGTGGTLRLAAALQGEWLCMEVSDTGPGIPPALRERLFEPFFTTRPEGVGLGLFSCKRVAEEHGGRIAAENGAAGGAVFRVLLPHSSTPRPAP